MTGSPTPTCDDLAIEDAPQPSDLIYLGGDWYRVADSYDSSSPTSHSLALATSSAVDTSFMGATGDGGVDVFA